MKKKKTERLVRVHWDPPRSLKETLDLTDTENDYGVYQVYGEHVVFGSGALLYIGKARDQTFGTRFDQHRAWLKHESDPLVRVGRLREDDYEQKRGWSDWKKAIDCVEELTIYWHSPPYNSRCIVGYANELLRVQNWFHRGRLLPEYSSRWEPKRPDDSKER